MNSFRPVVLSLALFLSAGGLVGRPQKGVPSFDQLAQKADQASRENRLAEAADLYRKALNVRPGWSEGWWSLGTLQYDQNHYVAAAAAFAKLSALQPQNGTAHAMLGLCQIELKQDDLALKNLTLAQHQGVQNDRQLQHVVLYQLGSLQLRKRKFGDASTTIMLLVKDGERSSQVESALGMAALLIQPQNPSAEGSPGRDVIGRVGRARVLAILKDFETAKKTFTLVAAEYPAFPNLHYAFGRFLLEAHETDEAIAEFQKELQNDPSHLGAILEIAAVRYRVDSADGVKYAEQAVKINPQLPFAHYLLGLLYLDTGKAAESLAHLQIAQKAFPKEAQIYFALGSAYARLGRKEDAARMRAAFTRLNARKQQESEASVYGEQASGLLGEKLKEQNASSQPKP